MLSGSSVVKIPSKTWENSPLRALGAQSRIHFWLLSVVAALFLLPSPSWAIFPQQYASISVSRQFATYCTDNRVRFAISSAAEEIKSGVLAALEQKDQWKAPIVINVQREDPTDPSAPVSSLQMVELDQGFKIELTVRIGQDPSDIHFQALLVKAILMEMAYRNRPPVKAGSEYVEPPAWMVEGVIQLLLKRDQGIDPEIFKSLVNSNRLISLRQFLNQKNVDLDSASEALYQAYSLCLITLLKQTDNGPYHLAQFLRTLPESNGDPVADLAKSFPDLGKSEQTMEKWWSLNIARLSTEDRYRGLTLEETETRLEELLKVRIPSTSGSTQVVDLAEAKNWIKEKEAKPALAALGERLIDLSAQANALMLPIIGDYQKIVAELLRGKIRGTREQLAKLSQRRANVAKLMSDIADTLNWFEATQMNVKSNAFNSYLKKSKEWEHETPPRTDQISRALDAVEAELQ